MSAAIQIAFGRIVPSMTALAGLAASLVMAVMLATTTADAR